MIRKMDKSLTVAFSLILGTIICANVDAQTRPKDGECLANEIDLGDFCASLPPPKTEAEKKRRTITRFRGESMMPGLMSQTPEKPGKTQATPPAKIEQAVGQSSKTLTEGFMLQLGVFSTRERAEKVASSIISTGIQVNIDPLQRGDSILWRCSIGPFANRDSAEQSRDQMRIDERFSTAFVTSWKADSQ